MAEGSKEFLKTHFNIIHLKPFAWLKWFRVPPAADARGKTARTWWSGYVMSICLSLTIDDLFNTIASCVNLGKVDEWQVYSYEYLFNKRRWSQLCEGTVKRTVLWRTSLWISGSRSNSMVANISLSNLNFESHPLLLLDPGSMTLAHPQDGEFRSKPSQCSKWLTPRMVSLVHDYRADWAAIILPWGEEVAFLLLFPPGCFSENS